MNYNLVTKSQENLEAKFHGHAYFTELPIAWFTLGPKNIDNIMVACWVLIPHTIHKNNNICQNKIAINRNCGFKGAWSYFSSNFSPPSVRFLCQIKACIFLITHIKKFQGQHMFSLVSLKMRQVGMYTTALSHSDV